MKALLLAASLLPLANLLLPTARQEGEPPALPLTV